MGDSKKKYEELKEVGENLLKKTADMTLKQVAELSPTPPKDWGTLVYGAPEPKSKCKTVVKKVSKEEYFKFSENFFKECLEISKRKNADYTGGSDDPFANFKAVESLGISTEQGFLTRMMDKMKRIASFAENGELQVKDESVLDTLQDLANYSCLLAGYIKSKG